MTPLARSSGDARVDEIIGRNYRLNVKGLREMAKSKSMRGNDGDRKLAADHGRKKHKTGGEAQKETGAPRGSGRRRGSTKKS